MVPAAMTAKHVLGKWSRMNDRSRVRVGEVKFNVGQHVRISKEKMKFAQMGLNRSMLTRYLES